MCDLSELSDENKNANANANVNQSLKWINLTNIKYKSSSIGIKYFKNKNQIILIGGYNDNEKDNTARSFSIFEMMKNKLIEYPPTLHQHSWKPAILIQNNNTIYAIGNNGANDNSKSYPFGCD